MSVPDVAAKNAILDAAYGRGFDVALYTGHPSSGGVELSAAGGYARAAVAAGDWAAADGGAKETTTPAQFPPVTGPWSDTATHYVLLVGGVRWFTARLSRPLSVMVAGSGPRLTPRVSISDLTTP